MKYILFKNRTYVPVSKEAAEMIMDQISKNPESQFILVKTKAHDLKALIRCSEIISITGSVPTIN